MKVTYTPEGADAQVWDFDPKRVKQSQAELIERRAGSNFADWIGEVRKGNAKARRVLLWHLTRLRHPHLKFEDTPDFAWGELEVEHDAAETAELLDAIRESGLSEDEQRAACAVVGITYVAPEDRDDEDGAEVGEGKAPSPSSGTDA